MEVKGYSVVSISRLGVENSTPTFCEHCGRTIFNSAIIKSNTTGNRYRVGLDCLQTLLKVGKPTYTQASLF